MKCSLCLCFAQYITWVAIWQSWWLSWGCLQWSAEQAGEQLLDYPSFGTKGVFRIVLFNPDIVSRWWRLLRLPTKKLSIRILLVVFRSSNCFACWLEVFLLLGFNWKYLLALDYKEIAKAVVRFKNLMRRQPPPHPPPRHPPPWHPPPWNRLQPLLRPSSLPLLRVQLSPLRKQRRRRRRSRWRRRRSRWWRRRPTWSPPQSMLRRTIAPWSWMAQGAQLYQFECECLIGRRPLWRISWLIHPPSGVTLCHL